MRAKERKAKQKKQSKSIDEVINSHRGEKAEQWVDTDKITVAAIKFDRKTKNPKYIAELAASMKGRQQINAAIVRETANGSFELFSGECRYDAAKINNEPLLVRVRDCDDEQAVKIIITENEKRRDLCDYDKALAYIEYVDKKLVKNQSALVKEMGLAKSYVSRLFSLKHIPQGVRDSLPMNKFSSEKIDDVSSRIKDREVYIDFFIKYAHKSEEGTWGSFINFIDGKVYPKDKKPIVQHVVKSRGVELGRIKPTGKGYTIAIKTKLNAKQHKRFQSGLEELLKKCSDSEQN